MKKSLKLMISCLISFCVLSIVYFILAYTIGREIEVVNFNLTSYSNGATTLLTISIIFIIFFGLTIWYGNKKSKEIDFIIKGLLIVLISIAIIIIGVQSANIKSFNIGLNLVINYSMWESEIIDLYRNQANISFYFPQCYLLVLEIVQIIWASVMLILLFQTEEQRIAHQKWKEERIRKRKARLQSQLDKMN